MLHHRCLLAGGCLAILLTLNVLNGEEKPTSIASELKGQPLLYHADFEDGKTDRWAPSDPKAWKIEEQEGNKVLGQFQQSKVETPVRSKIPLSQRPLERIFVGVDPTRILHWSTAEVE